MSLVIIGIVTFLFCFFVYASFAEHWLHDKVMHHKLWGFVYPYEAHAKTHHGQFGADASYHLLPELVEQHEQDKKKIKMALWNVPVIVLIGGAPFYAVVALVFFGTWPVVWTVIGSAAAAFLCYYVTYEYLHWCFHIPKGRWIEGTRLFKRLDQHHRQHHANWRTNLNVVCRLADRFFGTLKVPDLKRLPT